jgi:hypothetical protein
MFVFGDENEYPSLRKILVEFYNEHRRFIYFFIIGVCILEYFSNFYCGDFDMYIEKVFFLFCMFEMNVKDEHRW